jgi:hypothetical protein
MAKKDTQPESEESALAARIDAMLDPRQPEKTVRSSTQQPEAAPPPLDIFKGKPAPIEQEVKTAPPIPGSKKEVKVESVAPPIDAPRPVAEPEKAQPPVPTEPSPEPSQTDVKAAGEIDDEKTDKAVDEIAATDSDALIAAEDEARTPKPIVGEKTSFKERLIALVRSKWFWLGVVILLLGVFAWPTSRYKILGLIIKEPITLKVIDGKTHTAVSAAEVEIGGSHAKTDANGRASINAPLGKHQLIVTKQYYKVYNQDVSVSFKKHTATSVTMAATGRQVPITVINKISGEPIANAEIRVLNTSAKTDKNGHANIVLPTKHDTEQAVVTRGGYNTAKLSVTVTSNKVPTNTIQLTPSGQIYFLSNQSGTIDVVKTNLDGSGRKVILTGTGKEDSNNTSLLASRDWRYAILEARRDTAKPALYLIDTGNDKVTTVDPGSNDLTLVGWYGHNFIYDLVHTSQSYWQGGREAIKSYDADRGQMNQIDQNQASGDASGYIYQYFNNFYIVNGAVVYTNQWSNYASGSLSGKSATIRVAGPAGQSKKDPQTLDATNTGYIQAALYEPAGIYYAIYNNADNKTAYFKYENQNVSGATTIDQSDFSKTYPTYLLSPSGSQTFWTELRDGKNTLFLGDKDAGGKKQIAALSDYAPYGWYGDNYLLASKNSSELYVMKAGDLKTHAPLKITDYYKPAQTFNGYGYGYGGL